MSSIDEYCIKKYNNQYNIILLTNTNINNEYDTYIQNVNILLRQTMYTKEDCQEKLLTNTLDNCIKEYLGVPNKEIPKISTNQNIFKAFREFF